MPPSKEKRQRARKNEGPRLCERRSQATGRTLYYATFNGRQVAFGSDLEIARQRHAATVAQWLANGRSIGDADGTATPYLVEELIADFLEEAQIQYRNPETGVPGGEYGNVVRALDPVDEMFGALPAEQFGGIALRTVRDRMVESGRLCRKEINARVHRIRRAFEWAVSVDKLPESVAGALSRVKGLKEGKTTARESAPVLPVSEHEVRAVTAHLCPTVAGIVWFQWWTGCRPGEACALRWGMIDRTGPVWVVEFQRHKTAHHGRRRVLPIGPRAQEAIRGLQVLDPAAFVFSPQRALVEQRAEKRAHRRTKVPPSQMHRADVAREEPREAIAESYTVHTMRRAIARGVRAANAQLVRDRVAAALARELGERFTPAVRDSIARLSIERCVKGFAAVKLGEQDLERIAADASAAKAAVDELGKLELLRPWGPNRLRHSAGTRLRREEGLEAARVVLGHARAAVTEIYAEVDHARSREIAMRHG